MIVSLADEQDDPLESGWLRDLARDVLRAEGLSPETLLGLTLVGEDRMVELHPDALGLPGPTDVLSFPLEDAIPGEPPAPLANGPPIHVGDVVICPAVVRRNAEAAAVRFEDELALMVVHGVLHLLGYEHVDDGQAAHMESRERDLLAAAGMVRR